MIPARLSACLGLASIAIAALATGQETQGAIAMMPPLVPGEAPPKLRVNDWLAGQAVDEFKAKHVYVLELFRSRSKTCRSFAKAYEELASKLKKKATFVAVSMLDNDQGVDVAAYMKDCAQKPSYSLGSDAQATPKDHFGFMSQNWLLPSGVTELPAIVIVGKDQKLAWFGKANEAADPLNKIIDGKWDVGAFAADLKAKAAKRAAENEAWGKHPVKLELDKIAQLMKDEKGDEVLQEVDKLAEMDGTGSRIKPKQYAAYFKVSVYSALQDLDNFYKASADVLDICADDAGYLNNTAWAIVDPESKVPEKHWELAIKLAEKATTVDKSQSAFWDTLGWAYFGNGQKDKAAEAEKRAIELSDDLDQEDEYRAALAKFQRKDI